MRRLLCLALGAAAGCGGEAGVPPHAPRPAEAPEPLPAVAAAARPAQYTLADPDGRSAGTALALDDEGLGVVLDGARVVLSGGAVRVAPELTDRSTRVEVVPAWLGGGFLFHGGGSVYLSPTFDGPLRPVAAVGTGLARVSFGPKGALLRGNGGERFAVALPSGARLPPSPVGLVDVAMLPDGRVAALTEGGGALVSWDRGERWTDVAPRLAAAPANVLALGNELWISDHGGRALRVEAARGDGPRGASGDPFTAFSQLPSRPRPALRKRDARWRSNDPPLRRAIRAGARVDDGAAIVADAGDVVKVDLARGTIDVLAPGKLPPDVACEALRLPTEVLFVCAGSATPALIASLPNGSKEPRIERTFGAAAPIYTSDDGAIAYAGPCAGAKRTPLVACVRSTDGDWREVRATSPAEDDPDPRAVAGAPAPPAPAAVRWIPRSDGGAFAVSAGPRPDTLELFAGERRLVDLSELPRQAADAVARAARPGAPPTSGRVLDRQWSVAPRGALRGWLDGGASVEISPEGRLRTSAFTFPRVSTSGAWGFATTNDGRTWQSIDGGQSWVEVLGPPVPASVVRLELGGCSAIGCDLGPWLRFGWDPQPPEPREPPPRAAPAPLLAAPRALEVTCVAAGESRGLSVPATEQSPQDLGAGAQRIPVSHDEIAVERRVFPRGFVHPLYGTYLADEDGAMRAVVHGFGTQVNFDLAPGEFSIRAVEVLGPTRSLSSLKREVAFLEPFDALAPVRRASVPVSSVLAAARAASVPLQQLFEGQAAPEITQLVPVASLDPAAPSDLLFAIAAEPAEILGVLKGGASPRATVAWAHGRRGSPISAAATGGDRIAVLSLGDDGDGHVFELGGGVAEIAAVPAPPSPAQYPANPDAVAVGPRGALAVIRTPSGAEPPSAEDPALLLPIAAAAGTAPAPPGPPVALAAWSTLTAADDPACRADGGGYRAVVQTTGPWVRLRLLGSPVEATGPMLARVRWSKERVCLEAIEVRGSPVQLGEAREVETYVVARFVGQGEAGMVGVSPGVELRQPLRCAIAR